MHPVHNINVRDMVPLVSPRELKTELPMSDSALELVVQSRTAIKAILDGRDPRLMVVVGPCSIHDLPAGLEYARHLGELAHKVRDRLLVVMRVYFEKPRTTIGWKGMINDPHMNDTFDIHEGLRLARKFLLEVADLGLPTTTEMLEPITPQYIADLISLASIGARTTESPTHRQMASGLSMPVGYKNGTDGSLQVAVDAMLASRTPHSFLGIDAEGNTCIVNTKGNPYGCLILRGGRTGPNYYPECVEEAMEMLTGAGIRPNLIVDCSHANSGKDHRKQARVFKSVLNQRLEGNANLVGMMLESNLYEGNQKLTEDPSKLQYGVSITDACIGWEETETLINGAYKRLGELLTNTQ